MMINYLHKMINFKKKLTKICQNALVSRAGRNAPVTGPSADKPCSL